MTDVTVPMDKLTIFIAAVAALYFVAGYCVRLAHDKLRRK